MDVRHVEARNSQGLDPIPGTEYGEKRFYSRYEGEIWVDGKKVAEVKFAPTADSSDRLFQIRYESRDGRAAVDALDQMLQAKGPVELGGVPVVHAVPLLGFLVLSDVHNREFLAESDNCYCYTVEGVLHSEPPQDGEALEEVAARIHAAHPNAEAVSRDEMEVIARETVQRELDLTALH
jgi:hypothetical protein